MNKPANKFVGLLAQLRRLLPMLRVQYHVGSVEVFGSFVRGDDREGSDLDLIVTLDEVPTLFEFLETENYLSDELGIRVDLVMKDSLKPAIGKKILEEAQQLVEQLRTVLDDRA